MRSRTALTALLLTGSLALAGCGADADDAAAALSVSSAYMPQPVSDSMAAGFLTIANTGGRAAQLTSVTSDIGEVTLHETVGQRMQEVSKVPVPANGQLVFKSGGSHLMFEKLKRKPRQGETVSVKLHFAAAEPVTVDMPVKPATYNPKTGH
ncbi:copper chaperone PCu(A)C [Streptomyces cadmiisoli]|uniref:copper chaperone PCu(A)C n=1 Tax=Streptomyces cadmiisoli TaxID=2184053 RepID=UPI0036658365